MTADLPCPDCLPGLIMLPEHGGDWARYVEAVYAAFKADFVDSKPAFRGRKLGLKRHPLSDGKEATFWHFISEGDTEAARTPNIRRCERIRWPRAIINGCDALKAKVWLEQRGADGRIHIWHEESAYLVVLADRGNYVLPWTAYPVEHLRRREKLTRRFKTYGPLK